MLVLVVVLVLELSRWSGGRLRTSISYSNMRVKYGVAISVRPKLEGFVVLQRIEPGKAMLVRTVTMLTKLLERFDPEQFRVRKSPSDPVLPFEHEYPGKAGLFWVRHEHFFQPKTVKIANFTTASLPVTCYECSWGERVLNLGVYAKHIRRFS